MFALDKWDDEEYRKELQELVKKDEDLVKEVYQNYQRKKWCKITSLVIF